MENWFAQVLRFSVFAKSIPKTLPDEIWPLLWEEAPISDETRPREGIRRVAAPIDGGAKLEVVVSPGRYDVLLSPAAEAEVLPQTYLGSADEYLANFIGRVKKIPEKIDLAVQRLAFGMILVRSVGSREDAYGILGSLLPVKLDPAKSREFLFQINYPETMKVGNEEVELNRIAKWSAMRTTQVLFQLPQNSEAVAPSSQPLAAEEHYVRCEIDNSTQAGRGEDLPKGELLAILDRLVSMAEVTAKGE